MSELDIAKKSSVKDNDCEIAFFKHTNSAYLYFEFLRKFTFPVAEEAAAKWKSYLGSNPEAPIIHIWDCQKMSGFESPAKNLWLEEMKKHQSQIQKIVLISDNIIFRGAARLMSKFTDVPLEIFRNKMEFELAHGIKS